MNAKLTICEYARVHNSGARYDALGAGITSLTIPRVPERVACTLLIAITLTDEEKNKAYPIEIRIFDGEGELVMPKLEREFNAPDALIKGNIIYATYHVQLTIQKAVTLFMALSVDGVEKDLVRLEVREKGN
jgi:hypothetical protein